MIDKIKTLLNRTNDLENKIKNITKFNTHDNNDNNSICFNKKLLNFIIIDKRVVNVCDLESEKNKNLYFQFYLDLNLASNQKVSFSVIVNNISIYKTTKNLSSGFNQISMMKNYKPLNSENSKISIEIIAKDKKQIILENISVVVWGVGVNNKEIKYQAIELKDQFLLSFLNNNQIFYKLTTKDESINNSNDFFNYKYAKDYSFSYDSIRNKLFLFKIDSLNNLFFSDFHQGNEYFIDSNVKSISCAFGNNLTLVCYVKGNLLFYIEINENGISIPKQIFNSSIKINKVYCYFNTYTKNFYIIVSDEYNSNILIESTSEQESRNEKLLSTVSINIKTYQSEQVHENKLP